MFRFPCSSRVLFCFTADSLGPCGRNKVNNYTFPGYLARRSPKVELRPGTGPSTPLLQTKSHSLCPSEEWAFNVYNNDSSFHTGQFTPTVVAGLAFVAWFGFPKISFEKPSSFLFLAPFFVLRWHFRHSEAFKNYSWFDLHWPCSLGDVKQHSTSLSERIAF